MNLTNQAASLFAGTPGAPPIRPTDRQVVAAHGGIDALKRQAELRALLPSVVPRELDRIVAIGERYQRYLADHFPENVNGAMEVGFFVNSEL